MVRYTVLVVDDDVQVLHSLVQLIESAVSPSGLYCTSDGRVVCTGQGRAVCTTHGRVECTTLLT